MTDSLAPEPALSTSVPESTSMPTSATRTAPTQSASPSAPESTSMPTSATRTAPTQAASPRALAPPSRSVPDQAATATRSVGTTLYRRTADGGLERAPVTSSDYRDRLRSRRWDPAPLANPESRGTDPWIALAAIVGLSLLTFAVLVFGYGIGIWS
jgi:hypothetical protein